MKVFCLVKDGWFFRDIGKDSGWFQTRELAATERGATHFSNGCAARVMQLARPRLRDWDRVEVEIKPEWLRPSSLENFAAFGFCPASRRNQTERAPGSGA
jgi:hypothetical protein